MSSDGKLPRIKNRAPAAVQITAEQLLREAKERQPQATQRVKERVEDLEELDEYRSRKRTEFETRLRSGRHIIRDWKTYGIWEASQGDLPRSRSVFERALDIDSQNFQLWNKYIEVELKNRNVQHARNLLDRAVSILPREDGLWFKYVHLEELIGNLQGVRGVFERWMSWQPSERAWDAYITFEQRYNEDENASAIWTRKVEVYPEPKQFIHWAKFEEDRGAIERARLVFAQAMEFFGEEAEQIERAQSVYTAFAKMETRLKEFDRARMIYKYALDRIPKTKASGVFTSYTRFEKQYGGREGIEDTVLSKRRIQYEEELNANDEAKYDYDIWFDYVRLEEDVFRTSARMGADTEEAIARVRDVYNRATAQTPKSMEKRDWRRYIFLWLDWALFEEIDGQDHTRARDVYKSAIGVIPHKRFTFAKLWLSYAQFEIRQLELQSARKLLGAAIGMCPKEKLFRGYIEMELGLKEFDRARKLYERALQWDATISKTWIQFAELERNLFDIDRARGIFELGINQSTNAGIDLPEVLWKAYIDFEFEEREWKNVEALYERLLILQTDHSAVKIWIAFSQSWIDGAIACEQDEDDEAEETDIAVTAEQLNDRQTRRSEAIDKSRSTFKRAYNDLKLRDTKESRVVLLEAWKVFERTHGTVDTLQSVENRMPRVVKKQRDLGDGLSEEYYDLLFPDDEDTQAKPAMALLQAAHAWRAKQQQQQQQQKQNGTANNV